MLTSACGPRARAGWYGQVVSQLHYLTRSFKGSIKTLFVERLQNNKHSTLVSGSITSLEPEPRGAVGFLSPLSFQCTPACVLKMRVKLASHLLEPHSSAAQTI